MTVAETIGGFFRNMKKIDFFYLFWVSNRNFTDFMRQLLFPISFELKSEKIASSSFYLERRSTRLLIQKFNLLPLDRYMHIENYTYWHDMWHMSNVDMTLLRLELSRSA